MCADAENETCTQIGIAPMYLCVCGYSQQACVRTWLCVHVQENAENDREEIERIFVCVNVCGRVNEWMDEWGTKRHSPMLFASYTSCVCTELLRWEKCTAFECNTNGELQDTLGSAWLRHFSKWIMWCCSICFASILFFSFFLFFLLASRFTLTIFLSLLFNFLFYIFVQQ